MKTIKLGFRAKGPMLACGADTKGAFAVAVGDKAYLEDGFGDLSDIDNLTRYEKAIRLRLKSLKVRPKVVVCDLHTGYFSTAFAKKLSVSAGVKLVQVQHHQAHVAGVYAENQLKSDCIGVSFDGTGLGSDGRIWGGEFFLGRPGNFKRVAHLEYTALPGGDQAVREPWRMAVSYLYKTYGSSMMKKVPDREKALFIKTMIDRKINSPLASSVGRLFDAVGSLVLGKSEASEEAELAMGLEKIASKDNEDFYGIDLNKRRGMIVVGTDNMVRKIMQDITKGVDKSKVAARFHNTLVQMIVGVVSRISKHGLNNVLLSGGVFQNKYLTTRLKRTLEDLGYNIFFNQKTSTTDAGIPLGQVETAYYLMRA